MKILLAVSGGIDSMSMADICVSHTHFCPEALLDAEFEIAHCNFHLRPGNCDKDEALVREWAAEHSLPFHKADFDTTEYAAEKGISIEMAARELRYAWFADLCRERGCDAVAVAHNANDNAETLVLNLLRGTGIRGLRGMDGDVRTGGCHCLGSVCDGSHSCAPLAVPPLTKPRVATADQRQSSRTDIVVIRPLLGLTRAEIEEYARERGVPWRTDSTNLESVYKRNRIRNGVFPIFNEINPSVVKTLNADIRHFRQASDVLDDWYAGKRGEVMTEDGDISVERLLAQRHSAYILYRILEEYGFNETSIDAIYAALTAKEGTFSGKTFTCGTATVHTAAGRIVLPHPERRELSYTVSHMTYSEGMCLKCPRGTVMLDSTAIPENAVIRGWKEGDWMNPLGMKGRKKISDLFVDLKYGIGEKERALVLASGQHVLALLGERIDASVRVTETTVDITVIKCLI